MLAIDDVIAFETDAIFSRVPLGLPIGERLGEWDETIYESLTYLKSGMYFGTLQGGQEVEKSRGITKGSLTRNEVVVALERERSGDAVPPLIAQSTRFVTLGQALHQNFDLWTHWVSGPREISVSLDSEAGKRMELLDRRDIWNDKDDGWAETQPGCWHNTAFSYPYEVEWVELAFSHPDGRTIREVRNHQGEVSDHEFY